ncbi:MAG: arylsulfotransferase family protein [Solirubrobacteraceae bacterium]
MTSIRRQFKFAAAFAVALGLSAGTAAAATPLGAYSTKGSFSFVATPNLHPPKIRETLHTRASKLGSGLFLMANFKDLTNPKPMIGQSGPLILDNRLQPVWFKPTNINNLATDLTVQTYNGKPALAWWEGVVSPTGATVSGTVNVVDQRYRKIASLSGDTKDGWVISPHESVVSGHTVWVTVYRNLPMDLSLQGGVSNGVLTDSGVQQYDLKTGKLLFTWTAFNPGGTPHIPLSASQAHPASPAAVNAAGHVIPWDAYHINSIQLIGSHTMLVSMRNTWAAYLVDTTTGNVIWTLSGKPSGAGGTFALPAGLGFEWQHMVRLLRGNRVSLFDDACCPNVGGVFKNPSGPSRGLVLQLDTTHNTASLAGSYPRAKNFDAAFLGSTELLSNGNVLVGWGSQPFFSVYSKSGKLLMDAALPSPDLSYRVVMQKWVGTPTYPPVGNVRQKHGRSTVYASWNGATEVASWRVLAGKDSHHLAVVTTRTRTGFETSISVPHRFKAYEVVALDGRGKALGHSKLFPQQVQFGGY